MYFRSGGSSGTPALSGFSYRDFQRQMRATADGLFAAGLDPARDRVMNLFFSGGLYGGFFSFAKVLELLDVTHLPMGAPADDDYRDIAQVIIESTRDRADRHAKHPAPIVPQRTAASASRTA